MSCNRPNIYTDVKHCVGQTNYPGTREFVFQIPREDIAAWPTKDKPTDDGATLASIVTIQGSFVLAADASWKKITLAPDVNSFSSEAQGNWGSKTFNNTVTVVHPGVGPEAAGLCAMLNNDDSVFLVPMRDGRLRLFGNEMFPAMVNPKQESGAAAASDSAQTTLEISVTDETPAPFYEGNVVLSDGSVISGRDCAPVPMEARPITPEVD